MGNKKYLNFFLSFFFLVRTRGRILKKKLTARVFSHLFRPSSYSSLIILVNL